ncbi:MAG TPA: tetratricopeptide repeat protein [Humisphaera sp.]|jgi:predicted O-linked N-acetylglucosamine transferase (SPINDLY family)|nr:tetratricopeptide repeat protein [Humisphaera sp.]
MPLDVALANEQVVELMRAGKMREAEAICRQVLAHAPGDTIAQLNLGAIATSAAVLRARQGRLDEAEAIFREALRLRPADPSAYANMALIVRQQGRPDEAIDWYRKAIAIGPNFPDPYNGLGSALRESGRIGEAVAAFRQAVAIDPSQREIHSNLVYAMQFDPDSSQEQTFAEHLNWGAKFAEPLRGQIAPHPNDRSPDRRLRVGYVSPDLCNHVVGWFMEPILEHHDREAFEVFCYADVAQSDDMSARLQQHCDAWRITAGQRDDQLAQLIREDGIDILVDLTLHMRNNRLAMFAYKPAPVQLTYLAYCGTSGMTAMDGCITDPHLSPPGLHEQFFTERLLRLPDCYWCYRPSALAPPVDALPASSRGFVTFGSLNSFAKVNDSVIETWSRILQSLPASRLILHVPGGDANASARERVTKAGIDPARVTLVSHQARADYFALYNQIDIVLDPFPYGGGTTSLDALWMGVPFITLSGRMPVGRAGVTLLSNLGLHDLIASSGEEYVRKAIDLAGDLTRLAALRGGLRARMNQSPLTDEPRFARSLESLYRSAWRDWCAAAPAI